MDNRDTRSLLFNQQISQNQLRAQVAAKREVNKALQNVHTEVKNRIKNNLFEPTEIPKCITRATFFLTDKEESHALANPEGTSLPPFHRQFLSNLRTESEETLNEMVKAICCVPRGTEDRYVEWLKEQQRKRFPETGSWAPERGLQLGSFGIDTLENIRDGFISMVVTPVMNKTFAAASTVVDDVTTVVVSDSTKAITTSAAIKSSAFVTGGYGLYKIGYNAYRVVKHGRSLKYALKNVIDDTGSVAVANAVGVGAIVALSVPVGLIPALLIGISLGALASWAFSPLINWTTRQIFNVSEDEYLDKAYRHFEVTQGTPLKDIFKKYRQLSRDNHEDKVRGKPQSEVDEHKRIFHKTQYAMAMISAAIEKNENDYLLARFNFEKADKEEYGGDLIADSWGNFKKWCGRFWKSDTTQLRDPRVLEITSGLLPYDLFLEEEDLEKLEMERLEKRIVKVAQDGNSEANREVCRQSDGNGDYVNAETSVGDLEMLLGD